MCAKKINIPANGDDPDEKGKSKYGENRNDDKLIKRKNRSSGYSILEPDWYKGEIVDANLKEYPTDYNKSGMREVIEIDISIIAEDGTEVIVKRFDNLNYHEMSNLSDTLRELDIDKPDVEGYLDLNEFISKKLEVRVGNKNKNGRTYNTVEAIKGL